MYMEAKYILCEQVSSYTPDDILSITEQNPDWIQLGTAWTEKGGSFVLASKQNPIPFTECDRVLYAHDGIPEYQLFSSLASCSPCVYTSSSPLISQLVSSTKRCYVLLLSPTVLFQLVQHLLSSCPTYVSLVTLVYFKQNTSQIAMGNQSSLSLQITNFNNLACVFRPQLTQSPSSPRFFHVDRYVHSDTIQETVEITATTKCVRMNNQVFLCFWTEYETDDARFYTRMCSINRFYQDMYDLQDPVFPPLAKVISGVASENELLDLYLMGPFEEGSIQPVAPDSLDALSQLIEMMDVLWSCGYSLTPLHFVQIRGQATFFNVTEFLPVCSIPVNHRQDTYEQCRRELIAHFPTVSSANLPQAHLEQYTLCPVENAQWSLFPDLPVKAQPLPTTVLDSLDEWTSFTVDSIPEHLDTPKVKQVLLSSEFHWSAICGPSGLPDDDSVYSRHDSYHSVLSDLDDGYNSDQISLGYPLDDQENRGNVVINSHGDYIGNDSRNPLMNSHGDYIGNDSRNPLMNSHGDYIGNDSRNPLMNSHGDYIGNYPANSYRNFTSSESDSEEHFYNGYRLYGLTPEDVEGLEFESSDDDTIVATFNDLVSISNSHNLPSISNETIERVFRESIPAKAVQEVRESILQPLSDIEEEEIIGSRVEQEIVHVEDPVVNEEWKKKKVRRIPYHGDEDDDIKRAITESAMNETLTYLCDILTQSLSSTQIAIPPAYQTEKSNQRDELEELPGGYQSESQTIWFDMGGSKDDSL